MPDAKASGSDANANGAAKNRTHNQGNQNRAHTPQQQEAVVRIRKCSHTAYYEILGVERSVSDGEIKKAYRKLSLLTHPDKNGYDGADEAFKMVSRAFQVLSDAEKKERYDRFGGDPDSRFSGAAPQSSPFSNFGRAAQGARGPMFEDEISPEELFNRFFGGGGFGAFGGDNNMFGGGGSQFVFNLGGGPGIRVHQFGGGRPRRRPREANGEEEAPQSLTTLLTSLMPLLILFVIPLLSSLFSGGETAPSLPEFRFQSTPPYTSARTTTRYKVKYFVNKRDLEDLSSRKLTQLDQRAETSYVSTLQYNCQSEMITRNRLMQDAQGWFFSDEERMKEAREMDMTNCVRLRNIGAPLPNVGAY